MNGTQAGWFPDPYGRHSTRYHDGERWTEHVQLANGATAVDPVPAATSAAPTSASGSVSLTSLVPTVGAAVAAGGLLLVLASLFGMAFVSFDFTADEFGFSTVHRTFALGELGDITSSGADLTAAIDVYRGLAVCSARWSL